jgi:hypothetical protein
MSLPLQVHFVSHRRDQVLPVYQNGVWQVLLGSSVLPCQYWRVEERRPLIEGGGLDDCRRTIY